VSGVARRAAAARVEHGGRELLSRAELARVTGERLHTLYKWEAARARNGYPDPVPVEVAGRSRPYFELATWRAWRQAHRADRRLIGGRPHATLAALAEQAGEPLDSLKRWHLRRASTGHPDAVVLDGRRYVDVEHWQAWHARHLAARRSGLTPVDRRGDPDELVGAGEVSRILGHAHPGTLRAYISQDQFITPDTVETLPSGRRRRRWTRRRVWEFADARSWSRTPGRRQP
jgi:hypothetical protein